ncbi:MAG: hypothetical protein JO288_06435 [Hyphomicrobiales bacterium]|nr:hypothetical protein [Hyphomicrobiales bacterium]
MAYLASKGKKNSPRAANIIASVAKPRSRKGAFAPHFLHRLADALAADPIFAKMHWARSARPPIGAVASPVAAADRESCSIRSSID